MKNKFDLIIEGPKDIFEILKSENILEKADAKLLVLQSKIEIYKDLIIDAKNKNIETVKISNKEFKNLRKTLHSQGIFLVLEMQTENLENILRKSSVIIFLDGVQDPGNFGTIVRTAKLFGVDAVLAEKSCAKLQNPKVLRSTKGYFLGMPIFENILLERDFLDILEKHGFKILLADSDEKAIDISDFDKISQKEKLCIIFGSEGRGISSFWDATKYEKICIKMPDPKQSLNVAVSCGIILFEVMKKWNRK